MRRNRRRIITGFLVFAMALGATAQKKPSRNADGRKSTADQPAVNTAANTDKVRDLVAFFELLLNTLGSSASTARDKEVIITESYAKIFRDANVQIEDDLDENRSTITNKDVVAYLKDVDFFFDNVTFEFTIDDITEGVNANGQIFYKVTLRRNLSGTTAAGKTVNNTIPRYIEVNYDAEAGDLKIASVYTHEFDEKEALTNWWNSLSFEWKSIFKERLNINPADSVALNDIKDMMAIDALDLSGNQLIQSLEPLGRLVNLRSLNIAGTQIGDLTPIRNLTELEALNVERTPVFDLSPLHYSTGLRHLNINNTDIRSIAVVANMPVLETLEMQFSHVIDFDPISALVGLRNLDMKGSQLSDLLALQGLDSLRKLNVARTFIRDLQPIKALTMLVSLNVDSTMISGLQPLQALKNLEVLYANYTRIADLSPLTTLKKLERVYCDQTPVNKQVADAFVAANPSVLIIFDSKDLQAWWNTLPADWQQILSATAQIGLAPGKEELARVTNVDSVNVSNTASITSLEPLRRLTNLEVVIASQTPIADLDPLQDHTGIRYLDISDTGVTDLSPLAGFGKLQILRADRTPIEELEPLFNLRGLRELFVDRTTVHDITAQEFLQHNPGCLIVYKTIHLDRWWQNLPKAWKEVFWKEMGGDTTVSREKLHRLVEQETFEFADVRVRDLSALSEFIGLTELRFSATGISAIPDLGSLQALTVLHATNSPLKEIGAISRMRELAELDISNTPIDDLKGLEGMENLRSLNCAGTQIKRLDALRSLYRLEVLDCSNTRVKNLDPVMYLSLRSLKCYNTRISERRVDEFKENNPDCEVVYY